MKKIYVLLFFTVIASVLVFGQQPAQYSLYMLNPYGVNPAAAGLKGTLEASAGLRTQWVGIDGQPLTQYINVTLPLSIVSSGVGISVHNESIGARSGLTAKASYNYMTKMAGGQLSVGISGGIVQGTLNGSKLRTPTGDYNQGVIDHKDNILQAATINGITPTFDMGIFFMNEKLIGGISASNLIEPRLTLSGQTDINVVLKRNYFALIGTNFDLTNNLTLHPSVLVKSDAVQTQMDFSTFVRYNDNIFLGGTFRGYSKNSQDAVAIFGGLNLSSKIKMAYSYDLTLSALKTVTQGTHEILIQYNLGKEFGKGKLPPIIYNPRF